MLDWCFKFEGLIGRTLGAESGDLYGVGIGGNGPPLPRVPRQSYAAGGRRLRIGFNEARLLQFLSDALQHGCFQIANMNVNGGVKIGHWGGGKSGQLAAWA